MNGYGDVIASIDQIMMVARAVGYHLLGFSMLALGMLHPRFRTLFYSMAALMIVTLISFDLGMVFPEHRRLIVDVAGWINTFLIWCLIFTAMPRILSFLRKPSEYRRRDDRRAIAEVYRVLSDYLDSSQPGNSSSSQSRRLRSL